MSKQFKPHEYQSYLVKRLIENKKQLVMADMGLGKTVVTLSVIQELKWWGEAKAVLIIAPLRVASITWTDEINEWDHLKNLSVSKIIGTEKERVKALMTRADIHLINRENTQWLVDFILKNKKRWPFDLVVIDESSSFKNRDSKRFKALRKATAITSRVIELTGTPAPNGYMDLWAQIYLLDQGQRLGKTITEYRNRYFMPDKTNGKIVFSYKLRAGAQEEIMRKISDIAVSMAAVDFLKMPDLNEEIIHVELPPAARKAYDEMEKEYLINVDGENITAANAAVLSNKLLQLANGAAYITDDVGNPTEEYRVIHDCKIEKLKEYVKAHDEPLMIFYWYKHDLVRLKEALKEFKPKEMKTKRDQNAWNAGKTRVLLAHPRSMGHGLNLQKSGNKALWFSLTWELESYLQANARLWRQGQKAEAVQIIHFVTTDSMDEQALARLKIKNSTQKSLKDMVRARIRRIQE